MRDRAAARPPRSSTTAETGRLGEDYDGREGLAAGRASALGVVALGALGWAQRRNYRRTNRVFNHGLLGATAAATVVLLWLVVGHSRRPRRAERRPTTHGAKSLKVLNEARIASLQARGNENLTLVARGRACWTALRQGRTTSTTAGCRRGHGRRRRATGLLDRALRPRRRRRGPRAGAGRAATACREWQAAPQGGPRADDAGDYEDALEKVIGAQRTVHRRVLRPGRRGAGAGAAATSSGEFTAGGRRRARRAERAGGRAPGCWRCWARRARCSASAAGCRSTGERGGAMTCDRTSEVGALAAAVVARLAAAVRDRGRRAPVLPLRRRRRRAHRPARRSGTGHRARPARAARHRPRRPTTARTRRRACGRRAPSGPAIERIKDSAGKLIVGRRPEQLPLGLPRPGHRQARRASTSTSSGHRQGHPRRPGRQVMFRAIPTSQRIPALQKRQGGHRGAHHDHQLRPARETSPSPPPTSRPVSRCWPRRARRSRGTTRPCAASGSARRRVPPARGRAGRPDKDARGTRRVKVQPVPNQLDCLVRLQLGQVDAMVTDNALAAGQAAQDPPSSWSAPAVHRRAYGVAMNKDDDDLVRRVNKVLEDYRSGGADSPWMRAYRHVARGRPARHRNRRRRSRCTKD